MRESEIEHFHLPIRSEENVLRLEISMDNAICVSSRDTVRDCRGDSHGLAPRNGRAVDSVAQRLTVQQLRNGVWRAARHTKLVNGKDVGVRQSGHGPRLALESRDSLTIGCNIGRQNLDGHFAAELLVASAIDLAHAARAKRGEDLVMAESRAGRQSHWRVTSLPRAEPPPHAHPGRPRLA